MQPPRSVGSTTARHVSKAPPPLRKGKWTAEEEAYVSRIVDGFNSGLLPLARGTTLRSYLAVKLHCDPMRISKKFAGASCLGKRVFQPAEPTSENSRETKRLAAELLELERHFLETIPERIRSIPCRELSDETPRGSSSANSKNSSAGSPKKGSTPVYAESDTADELHEEDVREYMGVLEDPDADQLPFLCLDDCDSEGNDNAPFVVTPHPDDHISASLCHDDGGMDWIYNFDNEMWPGGQDSATSFNSNTPSSSSTSPVHAGNSDMSGTLSNITSPSHHSADDFDGFEFQEGDIDSMELEDPCVLNQFLTGSPLRR